MLELKTIRNNIMQLNIQYKLYSTICKVENNGDLIRFNTKQS